MIMRKIILLSLLCLSLSACSSGVSQAEYESVVAERDEYKATLESIASLFGTDANNDSNSEEVSGSVEEPKYVELLEKGWVCLDSGDWTSVKYAVKIKNPNTNLAIDFPTITITAKDEDGKILSTYEQVLNSIAAGDIIYYGNEISYEGDAPYAVEISVYNTDRDFTEQDDTRYAKQSDFVISNTSENPGTFKTFTGEITNNSSIDFDTLAVFVLYKQGNTIVGADLSYVDNVMAGATKAFEISADSDMTQYDSYEFYAIQW